MKKVMISLLAVFLLAGCSAMTAKHVPIKTSDGFNGFTITSMYGGLTGTKEQSLQTLHRYSKNICEGEYIRLNDRDNIYVSKLGTSGIGVLREVTWEIKCNKPEQPAS